MTIIETFGKRATKQNGFYSETPDKHVLAIIIAFSNSPSSKSYIYLTFINKMGKIFSNNFCISFNH